MNEIVIIGGGIVGLATAFKIKELRPDISILILEKENSPGLHQTGNNSGVIHSGIYYKPGSLKATNCILGYRMLLDFCTRYDVPFEICGKIIVATRFEEIPALERLYKRGIENGLTGLKKLGAEEIKDYEPNANGIAGIHVPQTGIIDYKSVIETLASAIRKQGGEILLQQKVISIKRKGNHNIIETESGQFESKLIINCGGLYSDTIAALTEKNLDVRIIPFRGEYYRLKENRKNLIRNLVYPVPDPAFPFLGVHFTRMMDGNVEAGPNAVFAFAREGYKKSNINLGELYGSLVWPGFRKIAMRYWKTGLGEMYRSFSKNAFTRALQRLVPSITAGDLEPGGSGVRAQACDRKGNLLDDFLILENDSAINVCNAPSPAATSALSIGRTIAGMALKRNGLGVF